MKKKVTPKWSIEKTIQTAKEALKLTEGRKQGLEQRLSAGLLDGLPVDLAQLESLETGRPAKTQEVKGLTGSEEDMAIQGAKWASAIREMVKRRSRGSGLSKAVGVGQAVNNSRSKSVASALETILTAAKENPEEIRACGILESDIQQGQAILNSLTGARQTQDMGMKDKKDLTTQKNTLQIRIEGAIEEISTSGYMHYMEQDPVLAKRFKDLIPGSASGGSGTNAKDNGGQGTEEGGK